MVVVVLDSSHHRTVAEVLDSWVVVPKECLLLLVAVKVLLGMALVRM